MRLTLQIAHSADVRTPLIARAILGFCHYEMPLPRPTFFFEGRVKRSDIGV